MTQLLRYTLADGQMAGCYTSDQRALVEAQAVPDDPTYGYLVPDVDVPVDELAHWELVGGQLRQKTPLLLVANPTPFAADGVTECAITVVPFVGCNVRLNGMVVVALTDADPALILTADTPMRWSITLEPQSGVWAEAITVEAV